jgi:hypothetical protein
MKLLTGTLVLSALAAVSLPAQMARSEYLDLYIVKVKPEKHADFEAIARKIVDANRKYHGDNWLTFRTEYGDNDTIYFSSPRENLAAIDSAAESFRNALKESFGANVESVMQDFDKCIVSARGEIRRRRFDLSRNAPKDEGEYAKLLGSARFIRTMTVRVRPGRTSEFEELMQMMNSAQEKGGSSRMSLVSQSVAGVQGANYYISALVPSLGELDAYRTSAKELLGEDFPRWEKGVADTVLGSETMISRILPALSNPPEAVVNVSRDFWMPPTPPATAARAKQPKKGSEKPAR